MALMTQETVSRPGLRELADGVRAIVDQGLPARRTAWLVADLLRGGALPGPEVLTEEERRGDPERYTSRVLHAEDGFSIVGLVWLPGQETPVHDHIAWCTFGVVQGAEHEILYRLDGDRLVRVGESTNGAGEVSGFAPPGDIHRVRNVSDGTAISIHIYGADVTRAGGSSVRRVYDLPEAEGAEPSRSGR
ncbi:cysteine dioxygenase family protein [Bailinhaonella thermotolerans]|uniref:Cysteine dioxygenase n=1 Tax=Bailinhaonella thermotolerans TaxID=1070861 RepID=A0A3A4ASV9_9ACTN|nr:cysteine dioxygenase family protein [Bailinhaonella thermotolerans]RJL30384.1 cysteine dioxygenase [Bailinhaonella thermotolerans]